MEPATHSILFYGETLPGYDRSMARMQLQTLLCCSPDTIRQVFSGERVRLRKGLSAVEAQRYELRLKGIGLKVVIEPPLQPDLLDKHLGTAREQVAPGSRGRAEVVCPACGEAQPSQTQCRACGINMAGFLAARAAQARTDADAVPPPASSGNGFIGVHFDGRFGRGLLMQTLLLNLTLINLALLADTRGQQGGALLATALAGALFLAVRAQVRRAHDLGWRGAMVLVQLIPLAGLYVTAKLLLWPGEAGDNRWGAHQRTSLPALVLAALAVAASSALCDRLVPDEDNILRELHHPGTVLTRGAPPLQNS